jgi:hypothetical protein
MPLCLLVAVLLAYLVPEQRGAQALRLNSVLAPRSSAVLRGGGFPAMHANCTRGAMVARIEHAASGKNVPAHNSAGFASEAHNCAAASARHESGCESKSDDSSGHDSGTDSDFDKFLERNYTLPPTEFKKGGWHPPSPCFRDIIAARELQLLEKILAPQQGFWSRKQHLRKQHLRSSNMVALDVGFGC